MNQADRKEFELIHNKIDTIKEDIDDLKQAMDQAHQIISGHQVHQRKPI